MVISFYVLEAFPSSWQWKYLITQVLFPKRLRTSSCQWLSHDRCRWGLNQNKMLPQIAYKSCFVFLGQRRVNKFYSWTWPLTISPTLFKLGNWHILGLYISRTFFRWHARFVIHFFLRSSSYIIPDNPGNIEYRAGPDLNVFLGGPGPQLMQLNHMAVVSDQLLQP